MNLNAYDNIIEKVDKKKTWIDIHSKILYSREIIYKPYISLVKRYNSKINTNSYFIVLLDNPPKDKLYSRTIKDDYGRIKIKLNSIWNDTYLPNLTKNSNIECKLVEVQRDGNIYFIDV